MIWDGKYDERGKYKLWLFEFFSSWRIDVPKSRKCFSARSRSTFFNLSFFCIGSFWRAASFRGIKIGNGEPSGDGDGGKAIVLPCRVRHREQGRRRPAARQSKRDESG